MPWPFLYRPGDPLSAPELGAACLDGDLVGIGEAFMPADAVETRELRAGSLRSLLDERLALTHESAAWVHGAIGEPPSTHHLQRCGPVRVQFVAEVRTRYRDLRLPESDFEWIAGVAVSTPVRTLIDLLRDRVIRDGGDDATVRRMLDDAPELLGAAKKWLDAAGPIHFKRATRSYLDVVAAKTT